MSDREEKVYSTAALKFIRELSKVMPLNELETVLERIDPSHQVPLEYYSNLEREWASWLLPSDSDLSRMLTAVQRIDQAHIRDLRTQVETERLCRENVRTVAERLNELADELHKELR